MGGQECFANIRLGFRKRRARSHRGVNERERVREGRRSWEGFKRGEVAYREGARFRVDSEKEARER
jgi:hypothetical protein